MRGWALLALVAGIATYNLFPQVEPNASAILPNGYQIDLEAAKVWISVFVTIMTALSAVNPTIGKWWNRIAGFLEKIPIIGKLFKSSEELELETKDTQLLDTFVAASNKLRDMCKADPDNESLEDAFHSSCDASKYVLAYVLGDDGSDDPEEELYHNLIPDNTLPNGTNPPHAKNL
jgi:hypothetical protein